MHMKFCIIGSGVFGINTAYQLLMRGHSVKMITGKYRKC